MKYFTDSETDADPCGSLEFYGSGFSLDPAKIEDPDPSNPVENTYTGKSIGTQRLFCAAEGGKKTKGIVNGT